MKQKRKCLLTVIRILLLVLIIANMALIFMMSHQNGEESTQTSTGVTTVIAQTTIKDFDKKEPVEQNKIITELNTKIRTAGHFTEFGTLGALCLLLLLTWQGGIARRYLASIAFAFVYACTDELHQQLLASGRAAQWIDIGVDTLGAFLFCSLVLDVYLICTHKRRKIAFPVKTTHYYLPAPQKDLSLCIAVASDLHGMGHTQVLSILKDEKPDLILIPGDLMEDKQLTDPLNEGYRFLKECAALAPTYYSFGNHEIGCYHKGKPWCKPLRKPLPPTVKEWIAKTGAVLLDDEITTYQSLRICGLTSGLNGEVNCPDLELLKEFDRKEGFHILLCHHPEYFMPHIQKTGIELTVSGHAHGGQWRIFGRGVFAPGQGIFPKYTSGVWENRLVISRGVSNHTVYPRILNAPEVVMIHYGNPPTGNRT